MKRQNTLVPCFAAAGMLMLILDSKTALRGAAEGLDLCITTLIPSLFPFFLLSILLTASLSGQAISFLRPVTALCKIPPGSGSVLAAGLLGGYPVGAQNTALLHQQGKISSTQAARMMPFCNNAGPAFIFGVLGSIFSAPYLPWLVWLIQVASAVCVGALLPCNFRGAAVETSPQRLTLPKALEQALRVTALVCGWVIIMRVLIVFLKRWFLWRLPVELQTAICGILELSNGCIGLSQIEEEGLRFITASGMLALGGVCVTLQTASVATGIPMRLYCVGKLLQCCICVSVSCALAPVLFRFSVVNMLIPLAVSLGIGAVCLYISQLFEKKSGIPAAVGV